MNSPANTRMPPQIGRALVKVKAALEPATRSGHDADGERQYSYGTADDIFAAVQKHLAENGLLLEMLNEGLDFIEMPGEDGTTRTAIHMRFLPVWNWFGPDSEDGSGEPYSESYENPRATIHMIDSYQGMKTCASLRTMAEKTYLRALLKLPTAAGEKPAEAPEGERAEYPKTLAGGSGGSGAKAVTPKNPFQLDKTASAEKREEIVTALQQAADADGDHAAKIRAVDTVFRKNQSAWAKLAPADQQVVKKTVAQITTELANRAGEAA